MRMCIVCMCIVYHKKQPPPQDSQDHHRTLGLDSPTVGSQGGAVSYERVAPVAATSVFLPRISGRDSRLSACFPAENPPGHLWRDKWTALSGPH